MGEKIDNRSFFEKDAECLAKWLIGKELHYNGKSLLITETEAYGTEDPMCYGVRYGKTKSNEVSFNKGGYLFVYCGMIMITAGKESGDPQNVLIRAGEKPCTNGPCKVKDRLGIDKAAMNGKPVKYNCVDKVYITEKCKSPKIISSKRGKFNPEKIKESYKGKWDEEKIEKLVDKYTEIEWRFTMENKDK